MFWTNAWKLGASIWENALALQETAIAASGVIEHRSGLIGKALRNPLDADLAELGRMVPEKVTAFGKAYQAMADDLVALQADMVAQSWDMVAMLGGGTAANAATDRMSQRGARLSTALSLAGGRALKPVHATATANHRRLKRAR